MTGHSNRSKAVKGDPYENLANAIIMQAVSDYRSALRQYRRHGKPNREMMECEKFFRSQWFGCLTEVDGEYLIRKIREEAGI